jgi:battenin
MELSTLRRKNYTVISMDNNLSNFSSQDETNSTNGTNEGNDWVLFRSFCILGVLNNVSHNLVIACAKSISEGGTGFVFLANVIPALVLKITAPYWFDHVSYNTRISVAALLMAVSFALIAIGSQTSSSGGMGLQLLGVMFTSAQVGLGEASLLALAGKCDGQLSSSRQDALGKMSSSSSKGQCLTSFASGTGLSGVVGFFWKWFWNDFCGFSLSATLWMAILLAVAYYRTYSQGLWIRSLETMHKSACRTATPPQTEGEPHFGENRALQAPSAVLISSIEYADYTDYVGFATEVRDMDGWQRFNLTASLWPYIIPLFLVYVAEYTLLAGTWTAIGFPVTDKQARDTFYMLSNWTVRSPFPYDKSIWIALEGEKKAML